MRFCSTSRIRMDYSLCCSISLKIYRFSLSLRFYCILRYSFARICFSKRLTSNCIRLSFISCSLASNSLRFLSVNLSVSNVEFSVVLGKGSLFEMGSCCCAASILCDSLINDCLSLLGGYWETIAFTFSFHSGLSRTDDFTSLMASYRF